MDTKPYELLESIDPELKFPGLYHEQFELAIDGATYLRPGIILALPGEFDELYSDDLFLCIQQVDAENNRIACKILSNNPNIFVGHARLQKGKRLLPMFHVSPVGLMHAYDIPMLKQYPGVIAKEGKIEELEHFKAVEAIQPSPKEEEGK